MRETVEDHPASQLNVTAIRPDVTHGKNIPSQWIRSSATLGLICVALLATWMGDLDGGYFPLEWSMAGLVLAVVVLLISLTGTSGPTSFQSLLPMMLLAAYTAWTFASMYWSSNMGDAWHGAGQTLLYLLVFVATLSLVGAGAYRRWVLTATVLGPALVATITLLLMTERFEMLFENHRIIGTVGYYNGEAAFLLVSFWVAIYLGGSREVSPIIRGLVLAGAVVNLELAIMTQSRGALVAMAVSTLVFFLFSGHRLRGILALAPVGAAVMFAFPRLNDIYATSVGGGMPAEAVQAALPAIWLGAGAAGVYGLYWGVCERWWQPSRGVVRVAGTMVIACMVVVLMLGIGVINDRYGSPVSFTQDRWEEFRTNEVTGRDTSRYLSASGSGRFALWEISWADFRANPAIGIGTQNYEATYYQLRERESGPARQPHSLPLEILSERGLVGGVLFFGFLGVCMLAGARERFMRLGAEGKAQIGALMAAVCYWFVHASAEWFWQLPAVTIPVFIFLALLVAPWCETVRNAAEGRDRWRIGKAAMLLVALSFAVFGSIHVSSRYLEQSYGASADVQDRVQAVQAAERWDPLNSRLYEREAELAAEAGQWQAASEAYEKTIGLNPDHYAPYENLASYSESRGNLDDALIYYREAIVRNPHDSSLTESADRLDRHLASNR